jgi:hypothetical protein
MTIPFHAQEWTMGKLLPAKNISSEFIQAVKMRRSTKSLVRSLLMDDEILINAYINPLTFIKAEEPWSSHLGDEPSLADVMEYLCTPGLPSDIESLIDRYRETTKGLTLSFAPSEENILSKLIWPLRHAKGCYMVGNYLGTIALCGLVTEMIAILFYEISEYAMDRRPLDEKAVKDLIGNRQFENLGQEKRVRVLFGLKLIDESLRLHFDKVRNIRRTYLHFYSKAHSNIERDAAAVIDSTAAILIALIGQDFHEGRLLMNPHFLRYLERLGIVKPREIPGKDYL